MSHVNINVRCVEVIGEQSYGKRTTVSTCGTDYTTAEDSFTDQSNKCPACGGTRAQEIE